MATDLATQGSDDSLRASLESAFESSAADTTTASTTTTAKADTSLDDAALRSDGTTETQEQKAQRARDEAGRFAKDGKAAEKAADKAPALDANGQPVAVEAKPVKKMPNSWKREVAAVWDKVDAGQPISAADVDLLRDEAIRRESDFHTGIQQYKTGADAGAKFEAAARPYEATFRALGVTADQAAAHLFSADHQLRHGGPADKATMVANLIKQYQVDPNLVFKTFLPAQEQEIDPSLKPVYDRLGNLEKENTELKQRWQTQAQSTEERELASFNNEIEMFANGTGKEHFQAVGNDMLALLPLVRREHPNATTQEVLEKAYDRAIWARPDLRASLLKQQTEAAEERARTQIRDQRAQTAAASVKGSSPVSGGASASNDTVRGALLAAMDGRT